MRLQRFREKTFPYNFDVIWSAGKEHLIADALSRAPVFGHPERPVDTLSITASDTRLQSLFEHASVDSDYNATVREIQSGKSWSQLPPAHPARKFKHVGKSLGTFFLVIIILVEIVVCALKRDNKKS